MQAREVPDAKERAQASARHWAATDPGAWEQKACSSPYKPSITIVLHGGLNAGGDVDRALLFEFLPGPERRA